MEERKINTNYSTKKEESEGKRRNHGMGRKAGKKKRKSREGNLINEGKKGEKGIQGTMGE